MSKQSIGIGAAPNDGTGDPLRTAYDKVNANFTELYTRSTLLTNSGLAVAVGTIADDGVASVPLGTGTTGAIVFWHRNVGTAGGSFVCRTAATSNACAKIASVGVTDTYQAGTLAGTTGTDGSLNFGAGADGNLYIENRTGVSLGGITVYILKI
jgi:hypothetical protein